MIGFHRHRLVNTARSNRQGDTGYGTAQRMPMLFKGGTTAVPRAVRKNPEDEIAAGFLVPSIPALTGGLPHCDSVDGNIADALTEASEQLRNSGRADAAAGAGRVLIATDGGRSQAMIGGWGCAIADCDFEAAFSHLRGRHWR